MPEEQVSHLMLLVTVPTAAETIVGVGVGVGEGGDGVVFEGLLEPLLPPFPFPFPLFPLPFPFPLTPFATPLLPLLFVPDWLALLTWEEVKVPPPGNADSEDWLLLPRLLEPEDNEEVDEPVDRVPKLDPPLLLVSVLVPLEMDPASPDACQPQNASAKGCSQCLVRPTGAPCKVTSSWLLICDRMAPRCC